jgi:hypothetical protein
MRLSLRVLALATCLLVPAAAAQSTPVSDAFRKGEERASRHLVAGKDKQVARLKETFDFCASVRPPRLHPGGGHVHHRG